MFVWVRAFFAVTRICCSAAVGCSETAEKINVPEIDVAQGRENICTCDGFHDSFDF